MLFSVPSLTPIPVVVRFKSSATLDRVIAALQEHRRGVWGDP
jgi:hypothetical protein